MRPASASPVSSFFLRLFFVFASTRGYTILVLVAAQYLSARYILAPSKNWLQHLTDGSLFLLVCASSLAIAGGYLINNFYDAEKDRINRPKQYLLHQALPPRAQLQFYFLFNLLCLAMAAYVSYKAFLFFVAYIFGLWLYSHFLKKMFWASNLFAALLAITPFFAIAIYFRNFSPWVMYHAGFLFLIILTRDLIKDLQNFRGDWVRNYRTVAIVFGKRFTKFIVTALLFLNTLPLYFLLKEPQSLGGMYFYFLACIPLLISILVLLWTSDRQKTYLWMHNILKALLIAGVASIVLVRFTPF